MSNEESTRAAARDPSLLELCRTNEIELEVVHGPDTGKVQTVRGRVFDVGSDPNCAFRLSDKTVSRSHFVLRIEKDEKRRIDALRITDEKSLNGTFVDGTRVRDAYARPDSIIVIGDTTLRLRMVAEIDRLPLSKRAEFGALIGSSLAMRRVYAVLERVAPTGLSVLLEGETGTGKELAARAIHDHSKRSSKAFVAINCGALSDSLLLSELFGHERGAFTGATATRAGLFETADGGTLFLDEIGEFPMAHQPTLLRALQEREIRRLGSSSSIKVDVRVISATRRTLRGEVGAGRFRDDLYYRVQDVTVRLPALGERAEDIPLLVRHFEDDYWGGAEARRLPASVVRRLAATIWPGNVRELRSSVRAAIELGVAGGEQEAADQTGKPPGVDLDVPLLTARHHFVRAYVVRALEQSEGNVTRAAARARVGRRYFQQLMSRYCLRGDSES